jgi:hypothetical protein
MVVPRPYLASSTKTAEVKILRIIHLPQIVLEIFFIIFLQKSLFFHLLPWRKKYRKTNKVRAKMASAAGLCWWLVSALD